MQNLLSTQNLVLERKNGLRFIYPAISLQGGDTCLLTGFSGSGKTTLLSIIAGLLPPTAGTVLFEGQNLYSLSNRERDKVRGGKIGFVFQNLHLLRSLTLKQNIALAADFVGDNKDSRVDRVIADLGLADKTNSYPSSLSQGEQQRAAIARAVLNSPVLILADEPTSSLDRDNALNVIRLLINESQKSGAALIVASHDERIMPLFKNIIEIGTAQKVIAA